MTIGLLTIQVHLPGCTSLKEKRSLIKPVISRLHREFNVSVAENGWNDHWQHAILVCALVCNEIPYAQKSLQSVLKFIEKYYPNLEIIDHRIEIM